MQCVKHHFSVELFFEMKNPVIRRDKRRVKNLNYKKCATLFL